MAKQRNGIQITVITLQDFSKGCKKDDLKYLTDCPSEVASHSMEKYPAQDKEKEE